jgi:hypothetical protein
MNRALVLVVLAIGCKVRPDDPPPKTEGTIWVPGGKVVKTIAAPVPPPQFEPLGPDEGTVTVDRIDSSVGAGAIAIVRVTPGKGFHVSTDYRTKLRLTAPEGVTIPQASFAAGKGKRGDAETFSERELAFAVRATAARAGSYAIEGTLEVGICRSDSCRPRTQPIRIAMTAD